MPWVILAIILILIIAVIAMYNKLVNAKMKVDNSWSQIDVQLQRRFDLIPNFVETVKAYASHESETFEKIASLRTSWANANTVAQKANLDEQLSTALKTIMAVSENYPELKANTNFLSLQEDLKNVENELAGARKYYNAAARNYNYAIAAIPDCIVAKLFHHNSMNMFSASEEQRKNVKVEF